MEGSELGWDVGSAVLGVEVGGEVGMLEGSSSRRFLPTAFLSGSPSWRGAAVDEDLGAGDS